MELSSLITYLPPVSEITPYLVGGAVRDRLLGIRPHDFDFSVEADSYQDMVEWLCDEGFETYLESPSYFTVRAHCPKGGWSFAGHDFSKITADFVLCRKDGAYSDGRRPDTVERGTLLQDQGRRDLTINSIAMDAEGVLYDPFGGQHDLYSGMLRAVGSAQERFREDALRVLRVMRFSVKLAFEWDDDIQRALEDPAMAPLVGAVSAERRREELAKMFELDLEATLRLLQCAGEDLRSNILKGINLQPTMKERVR
jgi:tRNA nucleotidyltransferase (CCA-adding enzyme)